MLRLTILLLLVLAAPAAAKPGDLDWRTAFAVGDGYSSAGGMVLDARGRPVLAGNGLTVLSPDSWQYRVAAARVTASGRLDAAFGSGGRTALIGPAPVTDTRQLIARLPGGGAVIAAATQAANGTNATLYRIDAAGRQDMRFGDGGSVAVIGSPHLVPVALATRRGKILMLANAYQRGSRRGDRAELIRLDENGRVEDRATVGTGVRAGALLADARGTVVATVLPGRKGHPARVRVTTLGGRTRSFVLHSRRADHYEVGPVAIMRGPGRTLLVAGNDAAGGSFSEPRSWPWLVRVGADGRLDWRARPVGTRSDYSVRAATLDRRGRVVLAGTRGSIDLGSVSTTVMRITRDGRRDSRLGVRRLQIGARKGVTIIGSEPRAVAVDARGRIVLAGVAFDDNVAIREDLGRSYFAVARLRG